MYSGKEVDETNWFQSSYYKYVKKLKICLKNWKNYINELTKSKRKSRAENHSY